MKRRVRLLLCLMHLEPCIDMLESQDQWGRMFAYLCFRCTSLASLQLAARALVNHRVRSRMAQIAVPDDDGCIGLNDLEGVLAVYWVGHCGCDARRWN